MVIRRVVASGLVAIAVLLALAASVFGYVEGHFHDENAFVEQSAELAGNADVREHVFEGFRTELISLADELSEAESERVDDAEATAPAIDLSNLFGEDGDESDDEADDDAGTEPITDSRIARDQAIETILLDALEGDAYQRAFVDSLPDTREQIIATAEIDAIEQLRNPGLVEFDMRSLYPSIWEQLAINPATSSITENPLPDSFGIFKVADRDTTADPLWSAVKNAPRWQTLTFIGALLTLIAAVAIADRRPSTIMQFGGGLICAGILVVVVVYVVRALVPLLVGDGTSGPVVAVYGVTTWRLVRSMLWLAGIGAVLGIVGWVARLIWPDEWVIDHVSDQGGVRSIKRRRGTPAAEQAAPIAAMGGTAGYPPQAPYGYQQQWGQPYPPPGYAPPAHAGQPYGAGGYPPGYGPPPGYVYPTGPLAQPTQGPADYSPGRPTVPVQPVDLDGDGPPQAGRAAGVVPRVVATTDVDPAIRAVQIPAVDDAQRTEQSPAAQPDPAGPAAGPADDEWTTKSEW